MHRVLAAGLVLVLALAPTALVAPPPSLTESISPAPQAEGNYFNEVTKFLVNAVIELFTWALIALAALIAIARLIAFVKFRSSRVADQPDGQPSNWR